MKPFLFLILGFALSSGAVAQKQFVLKSDFLNQPDTVLVFTPANYADGEKWPVVYLLHGWSGNYAYWNSIIDCQEYSNEYETIIVCPDGLSDSWYVDSPVSAENQFVQFFRNDLKPFIQKEYAVDAERIYITGLSMGGHGALSLFVQVPDYFSGVGSLSGLPDLVPWIDYYGIARVFGVQEGKENLQRIEDYAVINQVKELKLLNKPLIVSCGTEDQFYDLNLKFIEKCRENQVRVVFIEEPGGHDSAYWSSAVEAHYGFFLGEKR